MLNARGSETRLRVFSNVSSTIRERNFAPRSKLSLLAKKGVGEARIDHNAENKPQVFQVAGR